MSFMEKFGSLLARPSQQPGPSDDQPWYLKFGAPVLGILGGFFCIIFGLFNTLTLLLLNVSCLIGGILQILLGFIVIALEAPGCFFCIDHVGQIANAVDSRPMWNKAAVYCVVPILPLFLCFGFGNFFACALIFGTGVLYGMMALGKKASREDMAAAAVASPTQMQPGGEGQMQMSTDQHITLMEDPDVWRPT